MPAVKTAVRRKKPAPKTVLVTVTFRIPETEAQDIMAGAFLNALDRDYSYKNVKKKVTVT